MHGKIEVNFISAGISIDLPAIVSEYHELASPLMIS
jgi:hypothetical protein